MLLVRGTASVELTDGVPAEYLDGARKLMPAEPWHAYEAKVRGLYEQMARIAIVPEWAKLLDFETRIPSAVEEIVRRR